MDTVDMGNMDMSMMDMSMSMVFTNTIKVSLWLKKWAIDSKGGYAGAMIGLFFISFLHEGMLAFRVNLRASYFPCGTLREEGCKLIGAGGCCAAGGRKGSPSEAPKTALGALCASLYTSFVAATRPGGRAIVSLIYGFNLFVSYLLMLAVMTMNTGFFFIIIGGLAIGHFAFFRRPAPGEVPLLSEATGDGCGCGC